MQLRQFLVLFSYLNLFIGIMPNAFNKQLDGVKKEIPVLLKEPCEIDNYYDSLVRLKTDNILLYKELNTPSGNKGLIIWKDRSCIYGVRFSENALDGCKKEEVNPDNQKLWLIALKFFYGGEKDYSVTRSKIETMHDFKIEIQALVDGKAMRIEFFDSSVGNKSEFLPEIARLCQDIIYNW